MSSAFYVTTPIYYVNDNPHIGHAYTTILADVLARYHRGSSSLTTGGQGEEVFFLTGLDDHGQKVLQAAQKRGVPEQQHCGELAPRFSSLWKKLAIHNDDFIRTTQPRHIKAVQAALQKVYDAGVYRTLRPKWPLDSPQEADGAALETLFLQELKALNDALGLGYKISYWRTSNGREVDFILYGPRGLLAFEITKTARMNSASLGGLKSFLADYPAARAYFVYGGTRRMYQEKIEIIPVIEMLKGLKDLLGEGSSRRADSTAGGRI